jgi:hypothetical protein
MPLLAALLDQLQLASLTTEPLHLREGARFHLALPPTEQGLTPL